MATCRPNTALITGACSRIGKAAAVALTCAGYRVIGTSRTATPDEVRDGKQTSFARRFLPRARFNRTLRKQFNIA